MLFKLLRVRQLNSLIITSYFIALLLFLFALKPLEQQLIFSLVILTSVATWLYHFRRYRYIVDTPTSQINSAAQGYVELTGKCALPVGAKAVGFSSGPPCVWHRYAVYRRETEQWRLVDSGQSEDTFLLQDESGDCVIDPEAAEIYGAQSRQWLTGETLYKIQFFHPGEPLYVLGNLMTLSGAGLLLDKKADTIALLKEWKKNPQQLLDRFDKNGDAEIDLHEWQAVRKAAQREVRQQHNELRQQPDIHLIKAPKERPFILSNQDPQQLALRYRLWSWLHLLVFLFSSVLFIQKIS